MHDEMAIAADNPVFEQKCAAPGQYHLRRLDFAQNDLDLVRNIFCYFSFVLVDALPDIRSHKIIVYLECRRAEIVDDPMMQLDLLIRPDFSVLGLQVGLDLVEKANHP